MKTTCTALGLAGAFVGLIHAADVIPAAPAFARYEPMKERSPFAVATAVAAPVAAPNFAKDLYVANAARTSDGDLITLASTTDKSFKEYLTTKGPVNGYKIESIDWSDRVGATKVTISKDGQTATLTFNQALLSQGVPGTPNMAPAPVVQQQPQGVPAIPQYNQPQGPGGSIVKPMPGALPTPPPRVRGVIPRNPTPSIAQPQPVPPQPQTLEERQKAEQAQMMEDQ